MSTIIQHVNMANIKSFWFQPISIEAKIYANLEMSPYITKFTHLERWKPTSARALLRWRIPASSVASNSANREETCRHTNSLHNFMWPLFHNWLVQGWFRNCIDNRIKKASFIIRKQSRRLSFFFFCFWRRESWSHIMQMRSIIIYIILHFGSSRGITGEFN